MAIGEITVTTMLGLTGQTTEGGQIGHVTFSLVVSDKRVECRVVLIEVVVEERRRLIEHVMGGTRFGHIGPIAAPRPHVRPWG